ncbi:MAG: anti-sigma factor [Velocimicrobium sp.]
MTCMETQRNMKLFIDDKLDIEQLEEFLLHIRSCESCREDLDVYYTILSSIKFLDEDKNSSEQMDVERFIKHAEEKIRRKHLRIIYKKIVIVVLSIVIALFIER